MTVRSTTSSNQPPPPFYTIPSAKLHRAAHLGSEATRRGEPVSVNIVLGREIDSAISITNTTPTLPVNVTQHIIGLQLSPRL